MSLIYSRNNNGPRTVPCGTPDVTGTGLEDVPSTRSDLYVVYTQIILKLPSSFIEGTVSDQTLKSPLIYVSDLAFLKYYFLNK